jgi:hypothetical protein
MFEWESNPGPLPANTDTILPNLVRLTSQRAFISPIVKLVYIQSQAYRVQGCVHAASVDWSVFLRYTYVCEGGRATRILHRMLPRSRCVSVWDCWTGVSAEFHWLEFVHLHMPGGKPHVSCLGCSMMCFCVGLVDRCMRRLSLAGVCAFTHARGKTTCDLFGMLHDVLLFGIGGQVYAKVMGDTGQDAWSYPLLVCPHTPHQIRL